MIKNRLKKPGTNSRLYLLKKAGGPFHLSSPQELATHA